MSGDYSTGDPPGMFALGNVIISTCAAASLGLLCYKIKKPFKQHSFNTFAYIILLLIVYALIGKLFCTLSLIINLNDYEFVYLSINVLRKYSAFLLLLYRQGFNWTKAPGFSRDIPLYKPSYMFIFTVKSMVRKHWE